MSRVGCRITSPVRVTPTKSEWRESSWRWGVSRGRTAPSVFATSTWPAAPDEDAVGRKGFEAHIGQQTRDGRRGRLGSPTQDALTRLRVGDEIEVTSVGRPRQLIPAGPPLAVGDEPGLRTVRGHQGQQREQLAAFGGLPSFFRLLRTQADGHPAAVRRGGHLAKGPSIAVRQCGYFPQDALSALRDGASHESRVFVQEIERVAIGGPGVIYRGRGGHAPLAVLIGIVRGGVDVAGAHLGPVGMHGQ